jgi:hypothetical protein
MMTAVTQNYRAGGDAGEPGPAGVVGLVIA